MAAIEDLHLGTRVLFHFTDGTSQPGEITGRLMAGQMEGEVDLDQWTFAPGQQLQRVKVTFPTTGMPPEYVSVSCSPGAVDIIEI